jgi:hypothetical protein
MYFLYSLIFLIFITIGLSSLGFLICRHIKINNISSYPIIGYSFLILILNYLFFIVKINISNLVYLLFFFFSITIFLSLRIKNFKFLNIIKKIILIIIIPLIFFLFLAEAYGEQYYVFRGNKWDWFGFVSSSHYLSKLSDSDYLLLQKDQSLENLKYLVKNPFYAYHQTVITWIDKITTLSLLGAIFLKINLNNSFYMAYIFKIFCIMLSSLSIYDFLKKYNNSNLLLNIFNSLVAIFSFWFIYIIEADYFRFLSSFCFFIWLFLNAEELFEDFNQNNVQKILLYIICISVLVLIYPEILFIIFLLFISYGFLSKKINFNYIKKNYYKFLLSILIILVFIYPNIEATLYFLLSQIKQTANENRWWTYFGAFLLGRENPSIDPLFSQYVKELIYKSASAIPFSDNLSLKEIFSIIHHSITKFDYVHLYLNIIPSIFGYYFLTDWGAGNGRYISYLLLLIFSFYLLLNFLKNMISIFNSKKDKIIFIKSALIVFIILSIFFILMGKLWTWTKLYFYFTPFIILILLFKIKIKNNSCKFFPNYFLMILMLIFPLYKFKDFNYGIGTYDSFPSIQKIQLKKEINWSFDKNNFKNCSSVILNFKKWDYFDPNTISDHFKEIYFTINLLNIGYNFNKKSYNTLTHSNLPFQECKINSL